MTSQAELELVRDTLVDNLLTILGAAAPVSRQTSVRTSPGTRQVLLCAAVADLEAIDHHLHSTRSDLRGKC